MSQPRDDRQDDLFRSSQAPPRYAAFPIPAVTNFQR
jgi:hypothetical protein